MKELIIYEFQAKHIQNALQLVSRILECSKKETCVDRDVMQSIDMLKNVLTEIPNTNSKR